MSERDPVIPKRREVRDAPPRACVYRGLIEEVYDGDTCTVLIELGLGHWCRVQVRLAGLDAPEIRGGGGMAATAARDHLAGLILGRWVEVRTDGDRRDKYGRLLARLVAHLGNTLMDVSAEMLRTGHAVPFMQEGNLGHDLQHLADG